MRMLMKFSIPVAAGNKGVKDGTLPSAIVQLVEQVKPEACYFTAVDGMRTGFVIFDLKDPAMIPSVCEPFFMTMDAAIELYPAMNLDEMKRGVSVAMKR